MSGGFPAHSAVRTDKARDDEPDAELTRPPTGSRVNTVDGTAGPSGPIRKSRRRATVLSRPWGRAAVSVTAVLIFIVLWWIVAQFVIREEIILPTPMAVVRRFAEQAFTDQGPQSLWPNLGISFVRVLIGWGTGLVGGVILGVVMATSAIIRAAIDPLLEAGRAIPPLALAPLLLVWFGIGELSKDLLLTFAALPVFAVSTTAAITGVDLSLRRVALTLGASQLYVTRKVVLPSVMPELFTAMRLASAFTWTTLVAAELIAATRGLGWMILQAGRYLDTATIFVGIVTIGIVAFLMDRVLRMGERYIAPWKGKG